MDLFKKIDYLMLINTSHDMEGTWKGVADEVIEIINNTDMTNHTLIKENILAIPDGVVQEYILHNLKEAKPYGYFTNNYS